MSMQTINLLHRPNDVKQGITFLQGYTTFMPHVCTYSPYQIMEILWKSMDIPLLSFATTTPAPSDFKPRLQGTLPKKSSFYARA